MMKRMLLSLVAMMSLLTLSAQGIYDFKVKDDAGKDVSLSDYKGKLLLIVNTATRCGFTPQYKDLEALYEQYQAQGLEILDFPCNQFGAQAPGTIQEIHQFCTANFNIKFPQFDKIDVNGENAAPLYNWLKSQVGFEGPIKWNFTKFLVSRDGKVLKRYESAVKITDISVDVERELAVPDFEAMINLCRAVTEDWKAETGQLMEATGLKLLLDSHEKAEGDEFVTDWIVYGKNITLETSPDGGQDPSPAGEHACELRMVGDTSTSIWITFWNEGDFRNFLTKAYDYGLWVLQEDGDTTYFVPSKRIGGNTNITSDEVMSLEPFSTFKAGEDNEFNAPYTMTLGLDY